MRVRIDEPREEVCVAEVDDVARRRGSVTRPRVDDATILDAYCTVANGRTGDWEYPASGVEANESVKLGARRVALGAGNKT